MYEVCVWTCVPLRSMMLDLHCDVFQTTARCWTMTNGDTVVMTCLKPSELCLQFRPLFEPRVSVLMRGNGGLTWIVPWKTLHRHGLCLKRTRTLLLSITWTRRSRWTNMFELSADVNPSQGGPAVAAGCGQRDRVKTRLFSC